MTGEEVIGIDRDGTAIYDYTHLVTLRRDPEYAQICRTMLVGLDVTVSTVWLASPPGMANFETMILDGPLDGQGIKYATEEEAMLGHALFVQRALQAGGLTS